MTKKPGAYGEFLAGDVPTRHADHIYGIRIGRVEGEAAGIDLHFRSDGQPMSLTIPKMHALFLLSVLKCWQLDEGFPFPDDPRDPNWRAGDHS